MENRKLFNWEIEKKFKDLKNKLEFEKTIDRLEFENFLVEHDYYNGKSDDIYTELANTYFHRGDFDKAQNVYKKLLAKWKLESKKFPDFDKKINYIVDKTARNIDFVPASFFNLINKFKGEKLETFMNTIVDRYSNYEKNNLLLEILDEIKYEFKESYTIFKIINSAVISKPEIVDRFFKLALKYKKDPIALLNNVKFTADLFNYLEPETLKELLDLPGIQTKFDKFIRFETFMEALDKIPSLNSKFFIDISNKLYKVDVNLAIKYLLKAIDKKDFHLEMIKDAKCTCNKEENTKTSVAETLLARALKEKDIKQIMKVLQNTFLLRPTCVADLDIALKYSEIVVKLSKNNPEFIKVHLQLLYRRSRSIDGPEGILEDDRYKHKEENVKYQDKINKYKDTYLKLTGQKLLKE